MNSSKFASFTLAILLASGTGSTASVISFPSGGHILHGVVYKPRGPGPFPAILFNHGSAPGMQSKEAFTHAPMIGLQAQAKAKASGKRT